MELTLTHVGITLSMTSIAIMLKLSYRFGQFMEQFDELKMKVRIHDQLLGIPLGAEHHTKGAD